MTPEALPAVCDSLSDERRTGGQTRLARLLGWDPSTIRRKLSGDTKITKADELAVSYLVNTGVDPRGMLSLFSTLWAEEQQMPASEQVSWFSTHPGTAQRMQATRQLAR